MRAHHVVALVTCMLLALAPATGAAQSPGQAGPSPSPDAAGSPGPISSVGPAPSSVSAVLTCDDMAGLLPPAVGPWPLTWAVAADASESVTGYPMAALLASLGLSADAVCKVTFGYGSNQQGVMIRFAGADTAGLLDAYVADAKVTAQTKGITIQSIPVQIGGRPGTLMQRPAGGVAYGAYLYQLGDTIVEMTEPAMADAVVAHLPAAGSPLPAVTPPPLPRPEPKSARADCSRLFSLISAIPGVTGTSSVGPDAMAGNGFQAFPPPPAMVSADALDQLGLDVWDVCRMDFATGTGSDAPSGRLWKLARVARRRSPHILRT